MADADATVMSSAEAAMLTRDRAQSTASSSFGGNGSGGSRRGAKTVSGGWRLASALLLAAACALIGGAIAVDRDDLDFAPALLWVRPRSSIGDRARGQGH